MYQAAYINVDLFTALYNETLRGCFTVGEKKKQKFFYINVKNIDVKK